MNKNVVSIRNFLGLDFGLVDEEGNLVEQAGDENEDADGESDNDFVFSEDAKKTSSVRENKSI